MTDSATGGDDAPTVEAVYPLTPLQEGMLFHTVQASRRDVYLSQVVCAFHGPLRPERLLEAWEQTVRHEPMLRTAFTWERRERPLQIVFARGACPFEVQDWRQLDPGAQQVAWNAQLQNDRSVGFDLSKIPLSRVFVVRLADDAFRMLWSAHHILLDGWSGTLVIQDVVRQYEALESGTVYQREPGPEFSRYVTYLQERDWTGAEAFWRRRLRAFTTPTALPYRRRATESVDGERSYAVRELSATTSRALEQAARVYGVTLHALTVAAWARLLHVHGGESDVVFGITAATRPPTISGIERAVGLLLNTVPFRTTVDSDAGVRDWLSAIQRNLAATVEHDDSPMSRIQQWSELPARRAPFDSLISFENFPVSQNGTIAQHLTWEVEDILQRSNYPLALLVLPGARLRFTLIYDRAGFDAGDMDRLLAQLETIVVGLAQGADGAVRQLTLLTQAERERVTSTFTRSPAPAPPAPDVLEMFAAHVQQQPDDIAVADESSELTYRELDDRSSGLAHKLQEHGVEPGVVVALMLDRSPALIVAMIGALKSGGAYAPLSTRTSPAQIAHVLGELRRTNEGREPVVVVEDHCDLPGIRTLHVDAGQTSIQRDDATAPPSGARPDDPAYVIYTSGSTGSPKGIVVERRQLAASTAARLDFYQHPAQVFLLLSSPLVDSSVAGIYGALCSGGTLVTPVPRIEQEPDRLAALIDARRVSHTLVVPSLYRTLVDHMPLDRLRALSAVIVAGENCPLDLVRDHHLRAEGVDLFNEYGPAEATVWATVASLGPDTDEITLGRPIPGARVYVLDPDLEPTPLGVPGQICLGGATVARGYLGQPDLTRERFRDDPFEPGGRLYLTGDRGRWLDDGRLVYLGRDDEQVKVRGYRVELGAVEQTLAQHPSVMEAVVVLADTDGNVDAETDRIVAALDRLDPETADLLLQEAARS